MSFDSHQLDVIEEKLVIGFPLSAGEDIEPVKHLVASFRKIWRWYNECPEFNSKFEETLFRNVYDDLSSKFRSSNSEIPFEEQKSDSNNSSSNVYNLNSNEASDDIRHSSVVAVKDDRCDSASPSDVEKTNSVRDTDDVCPANADTNALSLTTTDHNAIPVLRVECGMCDCEFPLLNNDPTYAYQMHAQTSEHIEAVDSLKTLHSLSKSIDDTTSTSTSNVHDASSAVCNELNGASKVSVDAPPPTTCASSSAGNAECNASSSSATHIKYENIIYMGGTTIVREPKARQRGRRHKEQQIQTLPCKTKNKCKEDQWIQQKGKWKYCILCDVNLPGPSQIRDHMNGQMHQDSSWVRVHVGNRYSCTLCNANNMSLDKLHEHLDGKRHTQKVEDRENPSLSTIFTNILEGIRNG